MARHSFIQMSKLSNVKGRISYISDPKRQEYLYATFSTREDMTFWNDLAKECQEEFKRFGTEGKCIEARELIIALPEEYTKFDPNQVLREFTEQFKKRYDVECVSALHHNKTKKNYHSDRPPLYFSVFIINILRRIVCCSNNKATHFFWPHSKAKLIANLGGEYTPTYIYF